MARIGGKNTKPELLVRRVLHAMGYRFRLHRKDLPGKPDIVLPKYRTVIFVHGCFWHGCERCDRGTRKPKTNEQFWLQKIEGNRRRDSESEKRLKELGWRVVVLWQCETANVEAVRERLGRELARTDCAQ
jgi:DNA mismatch endonuclease (patch repair protein)